MIKKLEDAGQLDNTYIIYTTDNGYHISQHRMHPGKECGFDTDVHIPMIIRGPGIPAGHISEAVTTHTDLAPTIMQLAGIPSKEFDGTPVPLNAEQELLSKTEHVTIEYWGLAIPEGIWGWYGDNNMTDDYGAPGRAAENNTYKAVRIIGEGYSLYYSVWCTNEAELYDMTVSCSLVALTQSLANCCRMILDRCITSLQMNTWSYARTSASLVGHSILLLSVLMH
jgi:arylsulfatase A-like enzyme